MKLKPFLIGLILCLFIDVIVESIMLSIWEKDMSLGDYLIYLTSSLKNPSLVIHIFYYSIYFGMIYLLTAKAQKRKPYAAMTLSAISFFAAVLTIDWTLNYRLFERFADYLKRGNHYLVFALIIIAVLTPMRIRHIKKINLALSLLALFYLTSCHNATEKKPAIKSSDSISNHIIKGDTLKADTIRANQVEGPLDTNRIISLIKDNPDMDQEAIYEIKQVIEGTKGDMYLLVGESRGNCSLSFLLWVDKGMHIKKCAELELNCDSELSYSSYSYKTFEQQADSVFIVDNIIQRALDKNLIGKNGWLKNGHTLDDVKTRTDTITKKFTFSFMNTEKVPAWPKIWR